MIKHIKYELKDQYKKILGAFLIVILLNGLLLNKTDSWHSAAIMVNTGIINVILVFTVLLFSVRDFSKELYENRGYLTLTLPMRGYQLIINKLVVAFIWFALALIIGGLFQINSLALLDPQVMNVFKQILTPRSVLWMIIGMIYSTLLLMSTIYFSITLSRISLGNRRLGRFVAFIIFVVINMGIGTIKDFITQNSQWIIDLTPNMMESAMMNLPPNVTVAGLKVNVLAMVFEITVMVILFLGTNYFIEKKIDL